MVEHSEEEMIERYAGERRAQVNDDKKEEADYDFALKEQQMVSDAKQRADAQAKEIDSMREAST
eukprot:gene13979-21438_t